MKKEVYSLNKRYFLWKGKYGENIKYWLFDTEKGKIYKLNETSFTMLSLFDGERTAKEVLDILTDMYDAKKERLKDDFFNLFEKWLKEGILIRKEESHGRAKRKEGI